MHSPRTQRWLVMVRLCTVAGSPLSFSQGLLFCLTFLKGENKDQVPRKLLPLKWFVNQLKCHEKDGRDGSALSHLAKARMVEQAFKCSWGKT